MQIRRLLAFVLGLGATCAIAADTRPALGANYAAPAGIGSELLGTRPPEWKATGWLNSPPLTLAELRGKVVLVRWWTGPQCPYCSASAEALNILWEKHRRSGLVVIGMYHHKTDTPLTSEHVETQTKRLGFEFPVAVDQDWTTLHSWWLDSQPRGWTSVTFLLDREGKIRHIHPGGAYYPGEPGYTALESAVEKTLKESP
jgi:peroxiredoxin